MNTWESNVLWQGDMYVSGASSSGLIWWHFDQTLMKLKAKALIPYTVDAVISNLSPSR